MNLLAVMAGSLFSSSEPPNPENPFAGITHPNAYWVFSEETPRDPFGSLKWYDTDHGWGISETHLAKWDPPRWKYSTNLHLGPFLISIPLRLLPCAIILIGLVIIIFLLARKRKPRAESK